MLTHEYRMTNTKAGMLAIQSLYCVTCTIHAGTIHPKKELRQETETYDRLRVLLMNSGCTHLPGDEEVAEAQAHIAKTYKYWDEIQNLVRDITTATLEGVAVGTAPPKSKEEA